jgi:hypothetical protein
MLQDVGVPLLRRQAGGFGVMHKEVAEKMQAQLQLQLTPDKKALPTGSEGAGGNDKPEEQRQSITRQRHPS